MVLEFTAPVRIESANKTRDRHWSARKRTTDEQRMAVYWSYRDAIGPTGELFARKPFAGKPVTITLTRIAPRELDDDNCTAGFKAVRDMVAELVEADDGDKRLTWVYEQERGEPREYAARIRIETKGRE